MQLLLDDKLAPITSRIGFLKADPDAMYEGMLNWFEYISEVTGTKKEFQTQLVGGQLEEVIRRLLPCVSPSASRDLLVPAKNGWTAYFDNGHRGTDPTSTIATLTHRMKCEGITIAAIPHTYDKNTRRGRLGALKFRLYGPEEVEWSNVIRAIHVIRDVHSVEFWNQGEPFPFEDTERFRSRRKVDRFTFDMLKQMVQAFDLSPFDEDFYLPEPNSKAILIEDVRKLDPGIKRTEYTLEEERRNF